jgi:hypothetical protein
MWTDALSKKVVRCPYAFQLRDRCPVVGGCVSITWPVSLPPCVFAWSGMPFECSLTSCPCQPPPVPVLHRRWLRPRPPDAVWLPSRSTDPSQLSRPRSRRGVQDFFRSARSTPDLRVCIMLAFRLAHYRDYDPTGDLFAVITCRGHVLFAQKTCHSRPCRVKQDSRRGGECSLKRRRSARPEPCSAQPRTFLLPMWACSTPYGHLAVV